MERYIDADLIPYTDDDDYLSQYAYRYDINEIPTADVVPKSEVERLRGILLQFTDIVHKWGTKNNIDTSEISLVPIMNEKSDSIIQQAKAEVAREIFAEIEEFMIDSTFYKMPSKVMLSSKFAELKKKYIPQDAGGS